MRIVNSESPSSMAESVPPDAVGRRVACDGERGTVRYVGAVPPTAGLWLGVEWDNPERGKHDGCHEGTRYFTCRHPTSGSFVRTKKVSFGVDVLTAMRQRYESEPEQVTGEELTISSKTVERVGFEAISEKQRLENCREVSLAGCGVCSPGLDDEILQTSPNIVILNLAQSLLCSWEDVACIARQLTKLRELQLGQNRLRPPADPASLKPAFANLKVLDLSGSALSWPELLECAPMWHALEELYAFDNSITELQRPIGVLQSLTVLDLSNNPLADGSEILKIAELPRLEKLNLSNTGLSTLQFPDVDPGLKTAMFPALKTLVLKGNNISEWWVVNELDKLASLRQLSIGRNPVLSGERNRETARQILIARLGQLHVLDSMEIVPEERKGAELDYCKMFGEKWLESGGHRDPAMDRPSAEFTTLHPRYQTLIQKYGAPEEGELKKQKPFALKNQLLTVTFMCPDQADRKPIQKKIPDTMTVQKVKGLLFRLLKVQGSELKLTYTSSKMEGKEIEIDNDLKPLQFYSVEDGDLVLVRWS
ncbi:tubulin-specific chaperone E isoform X1 [Conger conger]|uniref:tubulin-specific chaperone E isoform X1 n=2 Tax=Conger conger TaxID=82655 RepID=UPI002A5AE011|nr:tubulin-specific chaperone E isoform X1 [Conger conger]